MNDFKRILISIERILAAFYTVLLLMFIFLKLNIFEGIGLVAMVPILDLPNLFTFLLPVDASVFLYYLVLFAIPVTAFFVTKGKHLKLHIYLSVVLVLLVFSHLNLFYSLLMIG